METVFCLFRKMHGDSSNGILMGIFHREKDARRIMEINKIVNEEICKDSGKDEYYIEEWKIL